MGKWKWFRRALGRCCCIRRQEEEDKEDTSHKSSNEDVKNVWVMNNGRFEGVCRVCGDANCVAYRRNLNSNICINTVPPLQVNASMTAIPVTDTSVQNLQLAKPESSSVDQPCSSKSCGSNRVGTDVNNTGNGSNGHCSVVVANDEEGTSENTMSLAKKALVSREQPPHGNNAAVEELERESASSYNSDGNGLELPNTSVNDGWKAGGRAGGVVAALRDPMNVQPHQDGSEFREEEMRLCGPLCSNRAQQLFAAYGGDNYGERTAFCQIIFRGNQVFLRTLGSKGSTQDGSAAPKKLVARRRGQPNTMKRFAALGNPVLNLPSGFQAASQCES